MIKNAARVKFTALKLDHNPRTTRLRFMYFIEDLENLFDMFYQTKPILLNYPLINCPEKKYDYAKKAVFTFINSYTGSEVRRIIKETYGDGCHALKLLQTRCARNSPEDTIRIEERFNTTQIQMNETATKYIKRFRDAKLMAKSVGMELSEEKLIDKFLMSLLPNPRYSATVKSFQIQRRNENMTENYTLARLTMTEIESHLYTEDENRITARSQAYQVKSYQNNKYIKHNQNKNNHGRNNGKRRNFPRMSEKDAICYHCGEKGHFKRNCPKLNRQKSSVENSNVARTKQVVLNSSSSKQVNINMALHRNAGRRNIKVQQQIPIPNDLNNWVMDSGATCHMTPFRSDFAKNSESEEDRFVEVADGFTVPATTSGTVIMPVFTDNGEKLIF